MLVTGDHQGCGQKVESMESPEEADYSPFLPLSLSLSLSLSPLSFSSLFISLGIYHSH